VARQSILIGDRYVAAPCWRALSQRRSVSPSSSKPGRLSVMIAVPSGSSPESS
jgi:hypothetical protein